MKPDRERRSNGQVNGMGYNAMFPVMCEKFISATARWIRQIESKVVNRLRQVTSAIKQDGANQVNNIRSTAERTAAALYYR
jgi:hypothetical protein